MKILLLEVKTKGFKAASEKAPVLMEDGKITLKKFKGEELKDLIAAIAQAKAMGGRIGFKMERVVLKKVKDG